MWALLSQRTLLVILLRLSYHVVRGLVSDVLMGSFRGLYLVGARLVTQWRPTPFQMQLTFHEVLVEFVHHMCYFFSAIKLAAH